MSHAAYNAVPNDGARGVPVALSNSRPVTIQSEWIRTRLNDERFGDDARDELAWGVIPACIRRDLAREQTHSSYEAIR